MTMTSAGERPPYEMVQPTTIGHLRLLHVNGVGIDLDGHRVFADGAEISLPRKEFDLLHALLENAGRVVSRRELLDAVWGTGYDGANKTLEVHIRRLRRKLGAEPAASRIRTVRGIGYVFDVEPGQLSSRN
jgi:two-component system response regulator RegX3